MMGLPDGTDTERDDGQDIADSIAMFILGHSAADIMPIVGGFTLVAEYVDPDTGSHALFSLHDSALTPWAEYGMLAARLGEIEDEMQGQAIGEPYGEYDE